MDVDIQSYLIFEEIKDIPECNRLVAIKRYFVIKAYELFLEEEEERLRSGFRRKVAARRFCEDRGIKIRTFYRWYHSYAEKGLLGLVPKWGNRRKKTAKKKKPVSPVPTLGKTLSAKVKINLRNPLLTLYQINFIVQQNSIFPKDVKTFSSCLLDQLQLEKQGNRIMCLSRKLTAEEKRVLQKHLIGKQRNPQVRALALLMMDSGSFLQELMLKTQHSKTTIIRWQRRFKTEGISFVETKINPLKWEEKKHQEKIRVIDILHSPPMSFDINRTNWTYNSIVLAYETLYGDHLAKGALKRIIKEAQYTWKRARTMLTSKDPLYREKVNQLLSTLHSLTSADAFFFIDEAGPWRVKKYGGKVLTAPEEKRIIPASQPEKGAVYMIAALEAQTNQVVYQFISGKNASAIVKLLQTLLNRYSAYSRICLTWDALSSHNSKKVNDWITSTNANSKRDGTPIFEVSPLPSNAQFLNVVESTFRNIRKAVIYNSDYQSIEEMQQAITRFLNERNAYFLLNPRRAGNKIWDKELFTAEDLPGGLFRKM